MISSGKLPLARGASFVSRLRGSTECSSDILEKDSRTRSSSLPKPPLVPSNKQKQMTPPVPVNKPPTPPLLDPSDPHTTIRKLIKLVELLQVSFFKASR